MKQAHKAAVTIAPYQHLRDVSRGDDITYVVSILGRSDRLEWPAFGTRNLLRLEFDDIIYSSSNFIAPARAQIADLIQVAKRWNGKGTLLVHCRAGSSRSPAAAMIAVAALARPDTEALVMQVRTAKAYFRPNETMLKLADDILGSGSNLASLARSIPVPTRTDEWGPATIPLPPIPTPERPHFRELARGSGPKGAR